METLVLYEDTMATTAAPLDGISRNVKEHTNYNCVPCIFIFVILL